MRATFEQIEVVLKSAQVCCNVRHSSISPDEVKAARNGGNKHSPTPLVLTLLVLPSTARGDIWSPETRPN